MKRPKRTFVIILIFAEWCQDRAERLSHDLDIHVQPSRS